MSKANKVPFNYEGRLYDLKDYRKFVQASLNDSSLYGNSKKIYVYNVPCAFDIETTSFKRDTDGTCYTNADAEKIEANGTKLEKCAIMYVWQFGINGNYIIGRTWKELLEVCEYLVSYLHLTTEKKLIIYVHNLSFEFQFIRKLFEWEKVFSGSLRSPIYATTKQGIEFRCSYYLSGYPLSMLGEKLLKYPVKKMNGDLDYTLLRNSETPLTEKEIGYCINDIRVVMCYVQELIEKHKSISFLPITKTGFTRKYCRKNSLQYKDTNGKTKRNFRYLDLMEELQLNGRKEFYMLNRAFAGGFTHANSNYVGMEIENVASYDFTSSYPYVMLSEKFPMSHGVTVQPKTKEEMQTYLQKYCCIIEIAYFGILEKKTYEHYISVSKIRNGKGIAADNGRLVCAEYIELTITNIDYEIISEFYSYESAVIGNVTCYRKEYLPKEFINTILDLYERKTVLKGVAGKEYDYLQGKEMLNSCYGMCVTNLLQTDIEYNGKLEVWHEKEHTESEEEEIIFKSNISHNRFLFYPWGVFVTAYARRNLFTGIIECGEDYIYSDTDSIKIMNYERHKAYIDSYNKEVVRKLEAMCKHYNIPVERVKPKTKNGVVKLIGVWDFEGVYSKFKTLGAKRYVYIKDGVCNMVASGVSPKCASAYLRETYGNDFIAHFDNSLYIPKFATGKNLHTYIDYPITGYLTDYKYNTVYFNEQSGVHLEPTDFTLNMSIMFLEYIRGKRLQ